MPISIKGSKKLFVLTSVLSLAGAPAAYAQVGGSVGGSVGSSVGSSVGGSVNGATGATGSVSTPNSNVGISGSGGSSTNTGLSGSTGGGANVGARTNTTTDVEINASTKDEKKRGAVDGSVGGVVSGGHIK